MTMCHILLIVNFRRNFVPSVARMALKVLPCDV